MVGNRVTIVEQIYFQHLQEVSVPTMIAGTPYSYPVKSDEMPFQRKFKISQEKGWQKLPGLQEWLDGLISLLKIENIEGTNQQQYPTDAEKERIAGRIIQVGIKVGDDCEAFTDIPPGHSIRINASSSREYFVRCLSESAAYWLHAFPK